MLRIYTYIIGIAFAVAACGCSHSKKDNEPTPPPSGNSDLIVFSPTATDPTSRGALSDHLDTFTLWGAKTMGEDAATGLHQDVIIGYKLQWQPDALGPTNTKGWEYVGINGQTVKYWDKQATSYRFFGVAPHNDAYTSTKRTIGATTYREIRIPADAENATELYISDLWYCDQSAYYGLPVTLTMKQPYSFVRFSFIDAEGKTMTPDTETGLVYVDGEHDRRITEISFGPATSGSRIAIAGAITVGYPIEGPGRDVRFEIKPADVTRSVEHLKNPEPKTNPVLPTGEQGVFEISLVYDDDISDTREGALMVAQVPAEFLDWQPNMVYTYVFKISGNIVEFIRVVQVASTQWIEENGSHSLYNW